MRKILIFLALLALGIVIVVLIVFIAFKTYPGSSLEECDKVALEKFTGEEAESFKYNCYIDVAEEKKDISICEKIPDDNWQLEYKKIQCYAGVASSLEDLSVCDSLEGNIEEFVKKDMCLKEVADRCCLERRIISDRELRPICKDIQERGIKGYCDEE